MISDPTEKNSNLRVALFGLGKMGQVHLNTILSNPKSRLIAIADPNVKHDYIETRENNKIPIFSNPGELMEKMLPDIVHIVTPPEEHFRLAQLALEIGAHIYVEKPFTLYRAEAGKLLDMAREKGLKVCAGHQLLLEGPSKTGRELLKLIGKAVHIESYFSFRPVRRTITAAEQLVDILPHPVYLMVEFMKACSNDIADTSVSLCGFEVSRTGELRAIVSRGDLYGNIIVTLRGRPVESYLRIVGTNGTIYLDFVRDTVTKTLGPGASALSAVLNPYSQSKQILWNSTKAFAKMIISKNSNYRGIPNLVNQFYQSIIANASPPLTPDSIIQTVGLCESLSIPLLEQDKSFENKAMTALEEKNKRHNAAIGQQPIVLVTGGTGFLGHHVIKELSTSGWAVRAITRHLPPYSKRVSGVEYKKLDLSKDTLAECLRGVFTVVHCAAETAGPLEAHEENTVMATKNLLNACHEIGIHRFIHISSIAVLQSSNHILDEQSPVDFGNISRGPYVWAKAEAEKAIFEMDNSGGLETKILRLGPLIDYDEFVAPGRLGKEIGTIFVAVGNKKSALYVCRVQLAAQVINGYLKQFDSTPKILNLVEPNPPNRADLVKRIIKDRPDIRAFWLPLWVLRMANPFLKLAQRAILHSKKPIDICAAFTSEKYSTHKATLVINQLLRPK